MCVSLASTALNLGSFWPPTNFGTRKFGKPTLCRAGYGILARRLYGTVGGRTDSLIWYPTQNGWDGRKWDTGILYGPASIIYCTSNKFGAWWLRAVRYLFFIIVLSSHRCLFCFILIFLLFLCLRFEYVPNRTKLKGFIAIKCFLFSQQFCCWSVCEGIALSCHTKKLKAYDQQHTTTWRI